MSLPDVLGPLEGEVMKIMWRMDRATVRDVVEQLNTRRPVAYTTVMTVMNNLVGKGLLERTPQGKAFSYHAALTRDALLDRKSREAVSDVLARFGDLAIARFIETVAQLRPQDLERLKEVAGRDSNARKARGSKRQPLIGNETRLED